MKNEKKKKKKINFDAKQISAGDKFTGKDLASDGQKIGH